MRAVLGTSQRLFVAFALLVSTFAAASYLTLAHVRAIHDGLLQMRQYEEGVRLSLELASAVRDQYAHQAHTIILGNETHVPLYLTARRRVADVTAQVRRHVSARDERVWVDDIERASERLDRVFREEIVPAVVRRSPEVQDRHAEAQLLVTLIQDRSDRLVDRFETSIAQFQADVAAMQAAALHWTVFFVIGAPLLAIVVGLYVQKSVARPVARLRDGAERLARGDLDARIQIDTPDEFGALARQFNAMTESLKEHQEQLVQHEKLAGIGRLAAGVAHEINNPLAVILGYTRLLGRKAAPEAAADLRIIEDETLRAKVIVDGLLDLSRPLHVEREPVDLRSLADEAVERLAETALLDGVEVAVHGAGAVAGSAQKLRQVVLNLLKNAAEAAGPTGWVEIDIGAADGVRTLVVRDSGPGLSREALTRAFEPFYTSKATGTGLGLAVSKGIIQAHGGTIAAANGPTGGARFEVRLPTAEGSV